MSMTLEQVRQLRDRLRELADRDAPVLNLPETFTRWADIVDAHLAQPAQSVDVEKVREVIAELSNPAVLHAPYVTRCADKLTAALQEKED